MDHLGSGQEFDLARKKGGLNIVPPYSQKQIKVYGGRIEALESLKGYLRRCTQKYVILTDANYAISFDFRQLINAHKKSGADVTIVYRNMEIPEGFFKPSNNEELYYSMDLEGDRITKIYINPKNRGKVNYCMNMYVIEREKLIDLVDDAYVHGYTYYTRDLLAPHVKDLNIHGFEYTGYCAYISDLTSYFNENMRLLQDENRKALFETKINIYTKIRDDNPTRYIKGAIAKNSMVADGCVIEGSIENCVLARGVKIGKGARLKNCILMQDTVVEENVSLEYVITDKNVRITKGKYLTGNHSFQVYDAKGQIV